MTNGEIQKIYTDFARHFNPQNYPYLFREFPCMRRKFPSRYPHGLGHYAIFYTPVPDQPIDFMLVGNNPSWFDSKAKESRDAAARAEQMVCGLKDGPPKEILYMRPDFDFGKQLQQILPPQILENIVGLNRFWMQTGVDIQQFLKDLETEDAKKEFLLLQKECEKNTRKIVLLLKPKTVFLFGNAAQKTFLKTSLPCDFVSVRHPSNAGVSKAKSEIEHYLASKKYAA
jgi:hypothetical protein